MQLSVVVPALNEAETIPLILARLRDTLREETWEAMFVGDYVARTYEETKGRPLYVVTETCNLPQSPGGSHIVILTDSGSRGAINMDDGGGRSRTEEILSYRPLAGVRG